MEREEDILELLCRDIVERGPDIFSVHEPTLDAPFSFVSESFYQRFRLPSGCLLGKPLESAIDPRDRGLLRTMLGKYVGDKGGAGAAAWASAAVERGGSLVELRLICGGLACLSSMSVTLGSQGLIVVTRLHGAPTPLSRKCPAGTLQFV